jgi:Pyruvate phosphate dikinase, AMP/ATP-binding domain
MTMFAQIHRPHRWSVAWVGATVGMVMLGACSPPVHQSVPRVTATTAGGATTVKRVVGLNRAVGYGLLRVMRLGERPDPLDVVIYDGLPNEMPRVAGVITTVMQTPLSHVNLRAVQDHIPNAVVTDALDNEAVTKLVGRYVRYEVTDSGYALDSATQNEVETHHQNERPATAQTPRRDLTIKDITALDTVSFEQWTAFGVKSANVATLRTLDLPNVIVPNGFAVPFSFYDEFMQSNGLYRVAKAMLANSQFKADPTYQDEQLAAFRKLIKNSPMPSRLSNALREARAQFPPEQSIRCRSSTNNEDLPGFSGAGLYDSRTQHPDEGPLDKCIRQVFSSVWNLRAYLEREYYRIDHLATAMGVLLIPNTSNEQANGVAVSIDPVYNEPNAYYVNAQLGENLVTNPEALAIPEELLLYAEGTMDVVTRSSLVAPGTLLISNANIAILRRALAIVHSRFATLYQVKAGEKFAMEIEFKVTEKGELMIKQARTWQFH